MYGRSPIIPQNYPFKVEFAGLRGDLASMQRQGWEIAVDQMRDESYDSFLFRIAGRHRSLKLELISGNVRLERHFVHDAIHRGGMEMSRYFEHIVVPISFMAPRIDMVVYGKPDFRAADFTQFGMRELDMSNVKRFTLEELGVFKTFGNETELFVPEKKIIDVQEYLKDILVSQEDKQKEIRQRMLKESVLSKESFKNELAEAPKLRLVGY